MKKLNIIWVEILFLLLSILLEHSSNTGFSSEKIRILFVFLFFVALNISFLAIFIYASKCRQIYKTAYTIIAILVFLIPFIYLHTGYTIEEHTEINKQQIYNINSYISDEQPVNKEKFVSSFVNGTNRKYSFYIKDEETGLLKEKEFYAKDVLINISDSEEPSYSYNVIYQKIKYQINDNILFEEDFPPFQPKDDKIIITIPSTFAIL